MNRSPRRGALAAVLLAALPLLALTSASFREFAVPPLVFVSRNPIAAYPERVPGLGPEARAAKPGGRLLVRDTNGHVHELLPPGRLFDVSDPSVSWDGRHIVFAAV